MERNYGAEAYARLKEENARLEKALGFYADKRNYGGIIQEDYGETARVALRSE